MYVYINYFGTGYMFAVVQSLPEMCTGCNSFALVGHISYIYFKLQDALQLHKIDMKDLHQNHIDGKEFENVKTEETPRNASTGAKADATS